MENTILTEFVHDETRSEPEYPLYVWMALNRTADNTTFEWQPFKRPLNYINWEPLAPDNWQGNQRCVGLHTLYSDRFGKWNDKNCDRLYYSLCMKPKGDLSPNILLVKFPIKYTWPTCFFWLS